jgi:hypothetical protein
MAEIPETSGNQKVEAQACSFSSLSCAKADTWLAVGRGYSHLYHFWAARAMRKALAGRQNLL